MLRGIFGKKKVDNTKLLFEQTLGIQSLLLKVMTETMKIDPININKIEITYFSLFLVSTSYILSGKDARPSEALDNLTLSILKISIPNSDKKLEINESIDKYRDRYFIYNSFFERIIRKELSSDMPNEAHLMIEFFQNSIKNSSGSLLMFISLFPVINSIIDDTIDAIKNSA